jgi:hypothetical protein
MGEGFIIRKTQRKGIRKAYVPGLKEIIIVKI